MTLSQKQALLAKIVAVMRSQLGVTEVPRGSNWGNVVRQYLAAVGLHDPEPWCMAAAVWAVKTALHSFGQRLADTSLIATGSCELQAEHARTKGVLISAADVACGAVHILPGYLMVMWEAALGRYAHSGVVTVTPDRDGNFHSVEGNTNDDGGREGDAVMEHIRNLHDTDSGHAKYAFIATV